MPNVALVTLRALASASASGSSAAVHINADLTDPRAWRSAARLTLNVAAIAAEGLTVTLETSPDQTNWRAIDSWTVATEPGREQMEFARLDPYLRISWALVGSTPTAVFGVDSVGVGGGVHQTYFEPESITSSSLQKRTLENVPHRVKANACIVASGRIERALLGGGAISPIVSLDERVRQAGVSLAACQVLSWKGFNPESQADRALMDECTAAAELLDAIAEGEIDPGTPPPDPGGGPAPGDSVVVSCPPRHRCCC